MINSVSIGPGATLLTRIPVSASSCASALVNAITPALTGMSWLAEPRRAALRLRAMCQRRNREQRRIRVDTRVG